MVETEAKPIELRRAERSRKSKKAEMNTFHKFSQYTMTGGQLRNPKPVSPNKRDNEH